jgi:CheY-like chemotaxis protein
MAQIGASAHDMERKSYCLDQIAAASRYLLGILNDILDMSKIEAGKFELSLIWFHFEKMLQDVANVVAFRMDEKKLRFSVHIDPRIPAELEGDNQRLAQVVTNLLSNAAKFTPVDGRVSLSAVLHEKADSLCTIRVEVADTGIGIADADKDRLFESFEQAESGTARAFGGTGLGLPISRRIVEMMGGSIWVESVLGQGASFFFDFRAQGRQVAEDAPPEGGRMPDIPAVADAPDVRDAPATPDLAGACFAGYRVLLAEDIDINREIFCALVEDTGLDIEVAENGRIALEKFQAAPQSYDAILMDVQMPEMDGHAAAAAIRALGIPRAGEVPIIAMTANVFKEDIDKCLAVGMTDHIGKPIDQKILLEKLHRYLKRKEFRC